MTSRSAPYRVDWTAPARRALARLPEKVATAVVEYIYGDLSGNPRRVGRPLRFELEGSYSAHRGDFRVIYEIDDLKRTVSILRINHRADVYRRD